MSKRNEYQKTWMRKQTENGLCIFCRNSKLPNAHVCERHYFLNVATTLKNRNLASGLDLLWQLQEGKCYLTGRKLIMGVNASIDHIIPKCKNGKVDSLENVRWCDKGVNWLKSGHTINELIQLCKEVIDYQPHTQKHLEALRVITSE